MTNFERIDGRRVYKCCWNCDNGFTVCAGNETNRINASKRVCCASYPVSSRLENPFKQRYCKQFESAPYPAKGHFIDKKEAEKLNAMTAEELMDYWAESEVQDEAD